MVFYNRVLLNFPMELHNGTSDDVIFYENRADTMGWTWITIHIQSNVSAQLVFEYTKGTPFQSAVAIDDISLTRCNEEYGHPKESKLPQAMWILKTKWRLIVLRVTQLVSPRYPNSSSSLVPIWRAVVGYIPDPNMHDLTRYMSRLPPFDESMLTWLDQ